MTWRDDDTLTSSQAELAALIEEDELEALGLRPAGAPAQTPEAETALELCSECGSDLDGDLFHDVDELERPLCAACCPTCIQDRAETAERLAATAEPEEAGA